MEQRRTARRMLGSNSKIVSCDIKECVSDASYKRLPRAQLTPHFRSDRYVSVSGVKGKTRRPPLSASLSAALASEEAWNAADGKGYVSINPAVNLIRARSFPEAN